MIFGIFLKMDIPIMAIFMKNLENQIKGEFVKIQELAVVIIFVIFPQKCQFRLENFEISRNSVFIK